MIDNIRLPEIVFDSVEVMPGILAVTDGVVWAVIQIFQRIRNSRITERSYTTALDTDESH